LGECHARYFGLPMATAAATFTDPAGAVSHLEKISPEMRGCAILDSGGRVLAASEDPDGWAKAGTELLDAADAAGSEPVEHAHIGTGDGEVFCVRHGDLVGVAVAERFVLSSLMVFDLRTVLRRLAA
jgi:hypothetical protein